MVWSSRRTTLRSLLQASCGTGGRQRTDPSWRQHIPLVMTLRPLLLLIDCRMRWRCLWSCAWGRSEWAPLCLAFTRGSKPRTLLRIIHACWRGVPPGHVAVVQGLVWRGIGLDAEVAIGVSAHCFCIGMIGAALRLGIIGHLDGQRLLAKLHDLVAELQATPIPSLHEISTFTPACDIAFMRHELQPGRLFAN